MRPHPGDANCSGTGLASDSLFHRYRQFFGLRTLLAVSSVAPDRIEFVLRAAMARQFYGLSIHLGVAFHALSPGRSYPWFLIGRPESEREFHPPAHAYFQAHSPWTSVL